MPYDKVDYTEGDANRRKLRRVVGTGAAVSLLVLVPQFEGMVYHGYRDPVGVPTKCAGDTHNVTLGKNYTKQQCIDSLAAQLVQHAEPIMQCVPQLKGHKGPTTASVDLAYNIGARGFCRSSAARYFRQQKWVKGCEALGKYIEANGRVLPGLVRRRQAEVKICLDDVT